MREDEEIPQWSAEECVRICGHCWDQLPAGQTNQKGNRERKCRHCARKEEYVWVDTGLNIKSG